MSPDSIFDLLKNDPGKYKFNGGNELILNAKITDTDEKFDAIERLLPNCIRQREGEVWYNSGGSCP